MYLDEKLELNKETLFRLLNEEQRGCESNVSVKTEQPGALFSSSVYFPFEFDGRKGSEWKLIGCVRRVDCRSSIREGIGSSHAFCRHTGCLETRGGDTADDYTDEI